MFLSSEVNSSLFCCEGSPGQNNLGLPHSPWSFCGSKLDCVMHSTMNCDLVVIVKTGAGDKSANPLTLRVWI